MADQVEALAEQVLQRRWTKAGSTALEATDSYVAGWSSALHPDDIEIRAGSTSEVRAEPSRFDRHANALRRLTSTSLVAAVIAVAVTAGLALWAFGALDAGVDTLDAAVLWAQDRAASDTNDRTTARTTATDRVAADYDARIVATDSRGVRIRTACDDGATTDGAGVGGGDAPRRRYGARRLRRLEPRGNLYRPRNLGQRPVPDGCCQLALRSSPALPPGGTRALDPRQGDSA